MKYHAGVHAFLCAFLCALPACAQSAVTLRCVAVHDGDTLRVLNGRTQIRVRLYGIDAPELGQSFGKAAKQALSDFAFGQDVTLYPTGTDRYGRLLAWVFRGQRCVNRELVSNGLAWWYEKYAPHETGLRNAQNAARAARRGLWSAAAIPPWEYRREK